MFDILGRKQIFTMRLLISSIATIASPFIHIEAIGCLALVMSSVSLTVPFIPDLIHFNKRGLAYAWLGTTFLIALVAVFFIIQSEIYKNGNLQFIFMGAGICGIVIDMIMCWGFSDSYKIQLKAFGLNFR